MEAAIKQDCLESLGAAAVEKERLDEMAPNVYGAGYS